MPPEKLPPFRSPQECQLYRTMPKWRIWEAAMHLAAAATDSYDDAIDDDAHEALTVLRDELANHQDAGVRRWSLTVPPTSRYADSPTGDSGDREH